MNHLVEKIKLWLINHPHKHHVIQFTKFSLVGVINFAIDFLVLNFLSASTKIYSGLPIIGLNIISFAAATTNSYFMNKKWTFSHDKKIGVGEFSRFLAIYVGGTIINTSIVFLLTTFVPPVFGIHPQVWLNIAKVIALPLSTIWNFLGTKYFVFK